MPDGNLYGNFNDGKKIKSHPGKDDVIVDQTKDQLEEKMGASAMDINVTSRGGVVNISGFVDVLSEKKFAEAVTRSIDGVVKVENNITISMDSQITNKHIEKEVLSKLRHTDELDVIGVKVEDGVVNLVGEVPTLKTAHTAMNLASQIRGVKDVVNNTNIRDTDLYDDVTINNSIRQSYNESLLDTEDITVDVVGGKATLLGYVDSRRDAEVAKDIAMGIEGVRKVFNKLNIRKGE